MSYQDKLGKILNDYWVKRNEARPNGVKASHAHKEAKSQITQLFKEEVEQIIGEDYPIDYPFDDGDFIQYANIEHDRQRARLNKTIGD